MNVYMYISHQSNMTGLMLSIILYIMNILLTSPSYNGKQKIVVLKIRMLELFAAPCQGVWNVKLLNSPN